MKGVLGLFTLLVVAAVALIGFTGFQALQVKSGLEAAGAEVEPLVQDLEEGHVRQARTRLAKVQEAAEVAAANVDGPGWWLAEQAPALADDVEAVRTVADVTDVLARTALPDLVSAAAQARAFDPSDGQAALVEAEESAVSLSKAARAIRRQEQRLAALRLDDVHPRLAGPVEQVQVELGRAAELVRGAAREARRLARSTSW